MTQRTGIFAGLRRRRWALGLAFGYALLLNALLGTSVEAAMAAVGSDPLAAIAAAPHCDPGVLNTPGQPARHPADHQQTCPLCGPACPMTGLAPLPESGAVAFAAPPAWIDVATPAWRATHANDGRRLFKSDTDSQGPPAA